MKINQKGMTLVEVLMSLLLVSLIVFATVTFISAAYRSTAHNQEKEFATQKAISILDELKSFVENKQDAGALLDDFNEAADSPVLTTQKLAVPDDPVSSNIVDTASPSGWLYTKQITVTPIGDQDNRLVNVKVFSYKYGKKTLISEVAGVLRTIAPNFAPTQVYDVYLIAIDNIPGWWVYMQNIVPFVQATLQDIQSRNPGLEFRTHWIRKLAYGRDWQYAPYFNDATVSTANINKVYFYPGQLPVNDATYDTPGNIRPVSYYYLPSLVQARINIDGVIKNGYDNTPPPNPTYNPYPYSLADTYNNAMRWPDEKQWFDNRVSVGKENADAPTLRLLIEDMWQNPSKYRNAIIINLHGELFPFPPIRNYSDAARDPETFTDITKGFPRVVTHPENLHYGNSDNLVLRVYSYLNRSFQTAGAFNRLQFLPASSPIKVTLKNINWTPVAGDIKTIIGGADLDGNLVADPWGAGPVNAPVCPVGGNSACYTSAIVGSDTVLTLTRSPLVSPQIAAGGPGLNASWTLYGMEYIPAPMEIPPYGGLNPAAFTRILTTLGDFPKNTARWIITVPNSAGVLPSNSMIKIETRIATGGDNTTGVMYPTANRPQDLSSTYVWRGTDTWLFGDSTFANPGRLPITERWQIIGDPRHLPYADQKIFQGFGGTPPTTFPVGSGFNRYFDDFNNTGSGYPNANNWSGPNQWQGWTVANVGIKNAAVPEGSWTTVPNDDGWDVTEAADVTAGFGAQGMLEVDVNRIMQVFRTVLLRTNSVFTTLSGFSFSYLGMGNEIDYDQSNGFINGVPVSSMPYTGTGGARYERSITSWPTDLSSTYHLKYIKRNNNEWFAKYWLGELFPDDAYAAQWNVNGNLTAGTGATDFLRVIRPSIPDGANQLDLLPQGTKFVPAGRTTDEEGCTAFMNIGSSTNQFHHEWSYDNINALVDETGDLQSPEGVEIANKFYMPFPTTAPIGRPFYLNSTGEGKMPNGFESSANPPFLDTGYTIAGLAANGVHPVGTLSTTYYDSTEDRFGTGTGSGLVTLRETYNGVERGAIYNVVNGLDKTGEAGTTLIGKWSVLSLTDAFLRSGQGASPTRIRELPRILILPFTSAETNEVTSLDIQWSLNWLRWDGQQYVAAYPSGFTEDTQTSHVILYSMENGATGSWKNILTDAPATPGVRPIAAGDFVEQNHDPADSTLSYTWNLPAEAQCEGTIMLRVEAYRDIDVTDSAFPLHYAYHQLRFFRKDPDPDPACTP